MGPTAKLLVELVEAAQYDIELITTTSAKEPAMLTEHRQLLRDLQYSYHDLIAQLHLAISAIDSERMSGISLVGR